MGFLAFRGWLEEPTTARLVVWGAATALAALVKPTTLELGIAQGVLVLLAHRDALRRRALRLGWLSVLLVVGAHLVHARGLYVQYGRAGTGRTTTCRTWCWAHGGWRVRWRLSHTRVWVLGNDEPRAAPVAALAARGARFYAHVEQMAPDAELAAWLEGHAARVAQAPEGAVYELRGEGAAGTGAGEGTSSRTK